MFLVGLMEISFRNFRLRKKATEKNIFKDFKVLKFLLEFFSQNTNRQSGLQIYGLSYTLMGLLRIFAYDLLMTFIFGILLLNLFIFIDLHITSIFAFLFMFKRISKMHVWHIFA